MTGVDSFPGGRLAEALAAAPGVQYVAGVDVSEPAEEIPGVEFIRADIRSPLIQRVLTSTKVDTVVHCDLTSRPVSIGGRSAQKEWNVIGTMHLLGACQRVDTIRKVVVRSSTAVYGTSPKEPSIITEDRAGKGHVEGYAKDVSDAETYARDFGRRRPDVVLTILRMANVIGPTSHTNISQFFSLPLLPTGIGFDPRLQLLHESDAVEVLTIAALEDKPGVFNVAADGVMYLSQATRIARRLPLPIVTPFATLVGDALRTIGVVDFPTDQISLIVHGRVVDNTRLKTIFGYTPRYTTVEAFRDFLESHEDVGPSQVTDWERELYGLFERIGSRPRPSAVPAAEEGVDGNR